MKIAYVGNYQLNYCTEVHIAKTLEKLGHQMILIQERPHHDPGWINLVPKDVDMLLYTRTWGKMVTLRDLQTLKDMGIPTASYHLDLYVGLSRQSGIEQDPFWRTEYVFSADGDPDSQKFFESKGINHHWLLPAVYEDECVLHAPNNDESLTGDVIFVGGGAEYGHKEWSYRYDLVKFLEKEYGQGYKKFGHPQRTVRGHDLNQLYANSKIAVGDSVNIGFKHKNYTSDRLFESIGRGAFTIYPRIEGVADIFPHELQGIFYEHGNLEDLKKNIDYYLSNPSEREALRLMAHQFVKSHQTYTQRLEELLSVMEEEGAFKKKEVLKSAKDSSDDAVDTGVRINLGAGEDHKEGYINTDIVDIPGLDKVFNLTEFPWDFPDDYAHEIMAVDVIEHLPSHIQNKKTGAYDNTLIKFLEECHRIMKKGGTLYLQTPGWKAEFLWIDPTHVRGFDVQSMDFFDPTKHYGKTTGFYSKCKWSVRAEELENHNLRFWMEKI